MEALNFAPSKKNLTILFATALSIRLIVFFCFIQKNEYYKQPDSNDYHYSAISTGIGMGMTKLDGSNRPTFWRTPGYPIVLSCFYKAFGIKSTNFTDNWPAQTAAIIFQIILGSLISILIFFLALLLTNSLCISWITAIISALHVGFVLSDLYILTESLSIVFLIPFFIFFFKSINLKKLVSQNAHTQDIKVQKHKNKNTKNKSENSWMKNIIFAAIFLALFTWVRPMGQFVAVAAVLLILIFDRINFKIKIKKIITFLLIFFLLISPWYVRNYNITGKIFFCPMLGLYLNTFNAPKIIRATEGLPLLDCINKLYAKAHVLAVEEYNIAKSKGLDIATEIVHTKIAAPIILAHPFLFLKDWIIEVLKTTFDLYSYQLVAMAKNNFFADPIEEFLIEKWNLCLNDPQVPTSTRIVVYLEIIFEFIKWLGLICGLFLFWIYPLTRRFRVSDYIKNTGLLWLKVAPIIAIFVGMTGGFGYARLRLPVEFLMIILSLTFWIWAFRCKNTRD